MLKEKYNWKFLKLPKKRAAHLKDRSRVKNLKLQQIFDEVFLQY